MPSKQILIRPIFGVHFNYTLLDNAGNAVRVAMPEETFIDILAITGGNPFASLVIVNGDIWELKSIWYNKEYHTWRDERN